MTHAEMYDLERQILCGLLVHGQAEAHGYQFKVHKTPGTHSVSLSLEGQEVRREPLAAIMSLLSHFLFLVQTEPA